MANMTYCMFQNTLMDLEEIDERISEPGFRFSDMSDAEQKAARRLFELCSALAQNYDRGIYNDEDEEE